MKNLLVSMVLVLAFSGCATVWVHPSKTPEAMKQDRMECVYEGTKAVPHNGDPISTGLQRRRVTEMCMEIRGYKEQEEK